MKLAGLAVSLGPDPPYSRLSKRKMKVRLCITDVIQSTIVIVKSVTANIGATFAILLLSVINISHCCSSAHQYNITWSAFQSHHSTSLHLVLPHYTVLLLIKQYYKVLHLTILHNSILDHTMLHYTILHLTILNTSPYSSHHPSNR
jgi:hypothetical protein